MSRETGKFAEKIAANFLKQKSYRIIEENYNCPLVGEIDLIARDGFFLVFIEVKYSSKVDTTLFEKITQKKKRKIRNSASLYLQRNKLDLFCRFDAIFVIKDDDLYQIEHFENVISE